MTETPDEQPTDQQTDQPTNKPETTPETSRPRSATSRARRIGGAAASPAPARPTPTPGPRAETAQSTAAPTVGLDKPGAGENQPGAGRTMQFSLPGWAVWAPSIAFATAAVVFLALFLAARVGGSDTSPGRSADTRDQVLAAAKTCLATLNTYSYNKLDAAEAAGVKCTTGKLTTDYKRTMTTIIRKNAPTLQAVQTAKINTAGLESVTGNGKQWTVLAYGQLSITTKSSKQGRVDPFAVVARLQRSGNSWVLVKIDTVSSAVS